MSKDPNFFIVGAPKCGTTALATYLQSHPAVFMASPKEPHFFAHDFPIYKTELPDLDSYLALFAGAKPIHRRIGEASVWYLYSTMAAEAIRDFDPDALIIAMVRNPVDLVSSLHAQLLWSLDEDETDLKSAWELQAERASGQRIPERCRESAFLQYGEVGKLGRQLARYYDLFPTSQIMTIVFDEFASWPEQIYTDVLSFLGLAPDNRSEFPRVNVRKQHRFQLAARAIQRPPVTLVKLYKAMKQTFGIKGIALQKSLVRLNSKDDTAPAIEPEFRRTLVTHFSEDVRKLESLVGKDLTRWLGRESASS